jgi:hypothetical protein
MAEKKVRRSNTPRIDPELSRRAHLQYEQERRKSKKGNYSFRLQETDDGAILKVTGLNGPILGGVFTLTYSDIERLRKLLQEVPIRVRAVDEKPESSEPVQAIVRIVKSTDEREGS